MVKSKVYKFDLTRLQMCDYTLTYDEFLLLTGSGKLTSLNLHEVSVKYHDGSLVPFDVICQHKPNIKRIDIHSSSDGIFFEPDTTKKLVEIISGYQKLSQFFIKGISDNFDIEAFVEYLTTNPQYYIVLELFNTVSKDFKNKVREFWKRPRSSFNPTLRFRQDIDADKYDGFYDNLSF
uniref:Uncharacterized protein n=1 Tax=Panagrolaimus sp. ES5 TaxID=591445 RepID=A0AC34FGK6_9BILA